mmetsp:Transcript_30697/g.70259  ORF Transcript_30697/g.70259 Transcript_30697/m.70259 type:complete len:132 (-) Transcript_30697:275-670(-)
MRRLRWGQELQKGEEAETVLQQEMERRGAEEKEVWLYLVPEDVRPGIGELSVECAEFGAHGVSWVPRRSDVRNRAQEEQNVYLCEDAKFEEVGKKPGKGLQGEGRLAGKGTKGERDLSPDLRRMRGRVERA